MIWRRQMSNSYSTECVDERTAYYIDFVDNTETKQSDTDGVQVFSIVCQYDIRDKELKNTVIDYSKAVERRFYQRVNGVLD